MKMRVLLSLLFILLSVTTKAQIYKCSVNGKTEYQSAPCRSGHNITKEIANNAKPIGEGGCKQEGAVNFIFADMETISVLQKIADISDHKLVANPEEVTGRGAFVYTCQSWQYILNDVAKNYGLKTKVDNGSIIVTK